MEEEIVAFSDNGTWNTTVEQLLSEKLGPRVKDTVSAVVLTVVYSIIFITGSMGNICTCIVIVRNHCMQTTTNYYLFSLALSDLLLLFFGLPPELFSIWLAYPWLFGEAFCYLRPTILELTSYASVLTITAFTVERYIAVCRPLLSHKIAVLSRAVKIIVCIWIVSILAALPYAAHTRLFHAVMWPPTGQPVPDSLVCSIPEKWLEGRMTYIFQISTFLFFLAPVTLIICLYILIGVAVRRSPLSRGSSDNPTHPSQVRQGHLPQQPRRVVIRMLVAVTVAFIICWAPFHTQRLMVLYVHTWTPDLLKAQSHIFYISGVLYFINSTVNPILYNVISRRYRIAFKQTIFGACTKFKASNSVRYRLGSSCVNRKMLLTANGQSCGGGGGGGGGDAGGGGGGGGFATGCSSPLQRQRRRNNDFVALVSTSRRSREARAAEASGGVCDVSGKYSDVIDSSPPPPPPPTTTTTTTTTRESRSAVSGGGLLCPDILSCKRARRGEEEEAGKGARGEGKRRGHQGGGRRGRASSRPGGEGVEGDASTTGSSSNSSTGGCGGAAERRTAENGLARLIIRDKKQPPSGAATAIATAARKNGGGGYVPRPASFSSDRRSASSASAAAGAGAAAVPLTPSAPPPTPRDIPAPACSSERPPPPSYNEIFKDAGVKRGGESRDVNCNSENASRLVDKEDSSLPQQQIRGANNSHRAAAAAAAVVALPLSTAPCRTIRVDDDSKKPLMSSSSSLPRSGLGGAPLSHQLGLDKTHGVSVSLCKLCLSNTSSGAADASSVQACDSVGLHNGVHAFHAFQCSGKPNSIV